MKKGVIVISLMFMVFYANAQWGGKKITGDKNITQINRKVKSFTSIHTTGFFDVKLIKSNTLSLKLKGEENLLKHVKTFVDNDKLILKVEKGYRLRPSKGNTIFIQIPFNKLNAVTLSGSGNLESKDVIKTNNFDMAISGSGDVNISVESNTFDASISGSGGLKINGKVNDLSASMSGSGEINGTYLRAKNVKVRVSGSGSMNINCEQNLVAKVSGSGEVYYKGNPSVTSTVSGSGEVSKM